MDITKRRIEKILKAGANVILTTGGIDDMALKQFVDVGAMAVRRCKKTDLKRIAKATGGIFLKIIKKKLNFLLLGRVKKQYTLFCLYYLKKNFFIQIFW